MGTHMAPKYGMVTSTVKMRMKSHFKEFQKQYPGQSNTYTLFHETFTPTLRPNYQPFVNILVPPKNLPDNEVQLADFIDIKGMKAQGNQLTKLKVKEIVLTHPIEGSEPWPEDSIEEIEVEEVEDFEADDTDETTVEWDLTKNDEDEDQMTLF